MGDFGQGVAVEELASPHCLRYEQLGLPNYVEPSRADGACLTRAGWRATRYAQGAFKRGWITNGY